MTLAPLRRVDRIGHGPPNILYLALFLPCIKVHGAVQTQSLHLVFERRTDRRLIFNNVQGPGRLMAGRSGGGGSTSNDYWYRTTSVLYLYVCTYLRK